MMTITDRKAQTPFSDDQPVCMNRPATSRSARVVELAAWPRRHALMSRSPVKSRHAKALPGECTVCQKFVLQIDLVGYSDTARLLEQLLGAVGVQLFQQRFQVLVNQSLQAIGLTRQQVFLQSAGDNAILAFDRAQDAHRFAQVAHQINRANHQDKSFRLTHQQFRIGVASGKIVISDNDLESACGIVMTNAVRLESAAAPGEIIIDAKTYAALPGTLRCLYGAEEKIHGKRSEIFRAHRFQWRSETDWSSQTGFSKYKSLLARCLLW